MAPDLFIALLLRISLLDDLKLVGISDYIFGI